MFIFLCVIAIYLDVYNFYQKEDIYNNIIYFKYLLFLITF